MLAVRVHALRAEACDVLSLDLRPVGDGALPGFSAGSHIDLEVPVGRGGGQAVLLRQYSLCNSSGERHRYVVGVGRDAASRGGSAALHDSVRVGDILRISAPRNNFALVESAPHTVMIAGGIGITPLLAMARRLAVLGAAWTLYRCVRTPSRAAFIEELSALAAQASNGRVLTVFDGMPGVARLDIAAVVRDAPAGTHFYCCGPVPMMKAFGQATAGCDDDHVHVEWFSAPVAPPAPAAGAATPAADGSFVVHLKRKARRFTVPSGETILEVLLQAGIDVDYSCREGLCGTCETRVLAGLPDHRDPILAGKKDPPLDKIMVCVSRCAGPELVLDL